MHQPFVGITNIYERWFVLSRIVSVFHVTDDERKVGPVYRVLSQDLYATDMHGDEMGVRQDEMWRAKSRQYSRDAEIIGKISEAQRPHHKEKMPDLEKTGFIIIRQSLWNTSDPLDKRLVIKLFSNAGGWISTLEEMVAEEFSFSYAAGLPLTSFCVITRESEVVTYVRQVHRGSLGMENFVFYILGPENTFESFRIERKRVSAGIDYNILRLNGGQKVAEVDSKLGDIGGEFVVKVLDPVLADNEWFCRVLQSFAVMCRYRDQIKNKIDRGLKKWHKGKHIPLIHRYEASLLANPRKLTLRMEEFEEV